MNHVDAAGLGIGDDEPTRVMGVLNVSEESPYDPSVFDDPGEAAAYVDDELLGEGADIIDVGLESANKRFEVLSAAEERDRLETALETIHSVSGDPVFSIETRYAEVAAAALDGGFDLVNDICGFADPEMPAVCREYDVAVVKMASPPDLERPGAVEETPWHERRSAAWTERADYVDQVYEALKQHGLTDRTIVDPAFGGWSEAKTLADDRATFRRLGEFRGLGRPVLVSINRKNFLRTLADRSTAEALPVSLAATALAVRRGAHVVRTHDVAETVDAVRVADAFTADVRAAPSVGVYERPVETPGEALRLAERVGGSVDPASTVTRAFELTDVGPADRAHLARAAPDVGVEAVVGSSVLLIGSPAGFRSLAESVRGRDTLIDSLDVILEWTEDGKAYTGCPESGR